MIFQVARIDHMQPWNIEKFQDTGDNTCSVIELYPSSFNGPKRGCMGANEHLFVVDVNHVSY